MYVHSYPLAIGVPLYVFSCIAALACHAFDASLAVCLGPDSMFPGEDSQLSFSKQLFEVSLQAQLFARMLRAM